MEEVKTTKKAAEKTAETVTIDKDAMIKQLEKELDYYKQAAYEAENRCNNVLELYNDLFIKYINRK